MYLERAVLALRENGQTIPEKALAHLSLLKWDHINITGDYRWPKDTGLGLRKTASPGSQSAGRPYPNESLAYNF